MKNIAILVALVLSTLMVGCGASNLSHGRTSTTLTYQSEQSPNVDLRTGNVVGFNHNEHPCRSMSLNGYRTSGAVQSGIHWYCF